VSEKDDREMQQIRAVISFGLDAKAFMQSDMGRYLTAKANGDIESALDALRTVDAEDPKAIRALQNEAAAATRFLLWMGEAVTEGENAERQFIDSDS